MTWTPRLAALHQQNTNSISRMSPRWHQLQVSHHGSSHGNRVWKGEITWPVGPGVRPELFHKEHCVFSTHKGCATKEPGRKTSKNLGRWPLWGQHRALKRALPGIPKRHPCGSNGSHPCSGANFLGRPSIIDMNTRFCRSCMVDCKIAVCQVYFLLVLIFETRTSLLEMPFFQPKHEWVWSSKGKTSPSAAVAQGPHIVLETHQVSDLKADWIVN